MFLSAILDTFLFVGILCVTVAAVWLLWMTCCVTVASVRTIRKAVQKWD